MIHTKKSRELCPETARISFRHFDDDAVNPALSVAHVLSGLYGFQAVASECERLDRGGQRTCSLHDLHDERHRGSNRPRRNSHRGRYKGQRP
jgi:hypothetical protein